VSVGDAQATLSTTEVVAQTDSTRDEHGHALGGADIAVDAAHELVAAGKGTPEKMRDATWRQRVDALGRAHYKRYDESTATALGEGAELVLDRWQGDLRRLRDEAGRDPRAIRELLQEVPRLGPTGADIFCREVQGIWTELQPALDGKARQGAEKLGLPTDPDELARLVRKPDLPRLAAALTRAALDADVRHAVDEGTE